MTKQTIRVNIDLGDWFEMSDLTGSLQEIGNTLEIIRNKTRDLGYTNPTVKFEHYGNDVEALIYGERLETEEEYQQRIAKK